MSSGITPSNQYTLINITKIKDEHTLPYIINKISNERIFNYKTLILNNDNKLEHMQCNAPIHKLTVSFT